jgi:arylformamidase
VARGVLKAGGPNRYDLLYNPRFSVPEYPATAKRWTSLSGEARASERCYLDVPYGPHETERLDLFLPRQPSRALLLFIHGGYWRALDKRDFSFVAPAFTRAGVTVAVANYALCPAVEVRDIVMQMVQASAWLFRNGANFGAPRGRLHVCGHSAGGHLAAMMLACEWPRYAPDLPAKLVQGALAISGLYDLREIVKVPSLNADVRLTPKSALPVSPAFLPPATDAPFYMAVGEKETGGFHVQHDLMRGRWAGVLRREIRSAGSNHFGVLEDLLKEGSPVRDAALEMMDAAR